jgi:hypothetical protein
LWVAWVDDDSAINQSFQRLSVAVLMVDVLAHPPGTMIVDVDDNELAANFLQKH